MPPRKIGVITVDRSDWGHLRLLCEAIHQASDLELQLFSREDWSKQCPDPMPPLTKTFYVPRSGGGPCSVTRAMAVALSGCGFIFDDWRPDILVILGDRFEMLAATMASLPFAIPILHLHGGELTAGAFDNQSRMAISKMAHVHCVANPHAATVLTGMGETNIFVTGCMALDRFAQPPLTRQETADALQLEVRARWVVVMFHTATLHWQSVDEQIKSLESVLNEESGQRIYFLPNQDTHADRIQAFMTAEQEFSHLRSGCAQRGSDCYVTVLPDRLYCSLLQHAAVLVGNSSALKIEAPFIGLRTREVTDRQFGRGTFYGYGKSVPQVLKVLQTMSLEAIK